MRTPWLRFVLRRAVVLVVSLAVLLTATFFSTHLVPGDPARAGLGPTAPPAEVEARRTALHLDEPLSAQYVRFVTGVVRGDLGQSFTSAEPVVDIVRDRFPATARLVLAAFAFTLLAGIPAGMLSAILTAGGRRPLVGGGFSVVTGALVAVPDYLLATALVAVFAVTLGWLPVAGDAGLASYVLPVAALGGLPAAGVARIARVEMAAVLESEYMRMARSKRLTPRLLYVRHALPNALTATLTFSGLLLGGMFAGTVLVETVFAWPGLGAAVPQAIIEQDFPLVQGIVLLLGGIALAANTVVDALVALLDPRSSLREA